MDNNSIHIKIITHEKIVFEDDIDEFYVQAKDGRLGFLRNHVPVLCGLNIGVVKTIKNGAQRQIAVMGGILQFANNKAVILTDVAELDSDIDIARAREAQKRAKLRLESKKEEYDTARARLALAKAMTRLAIGEEKHL